MKQMMNRIPALVFALAVLSGAGPASTQEIDYGGIFAFSTADGSVSCIGGFWNRDHPGRTVGCTGVNGMGANNSASCSMSSCRRENNPFGREGYSAPNPKAQGTVIGGGDLPFTCHIETELVQCIGPAGEFIVSRNGVFSIR